MLILFKIEFIKFLSKDRNCYSLIIKGIFLFSLFAFSFLFGYNLIPFFNSIGFDIDIIDSGNRLLFLTLYLLLLTKIFFQNPSYPYLKPFLLFPFSKIELISYTLINNFINSYNIFITFFIVGFWLKNVLIDNHVMFGLIWLCMVFLFLFSTYNIIFFSKIILNNYDIAKIKKILFPNIIILLVSVLPILFSNYQLITQVDIFSTINMIVFCCISLSLIFNILKEFLYEDNINNDEKKYIENGLRFIVKDTLILLQLKLLVRNRLLRGFLLQELTAMMFVLFELQRLNFEKFEKIQIIYPIFLLIFISILAGYFFIVPYGMNIFGIESSYFPFLLTRNVNIHNYLESKIVVVWILSIAFTLVSSFFVILFFPSILTLLFCFTIYFMGVASYFLIIQSIKHCYAIYPQISLFQNIYNFNNRKTYVIISMMIPLIIFIIIHWFYPNHIGNNIFSLIILLLGIIGILLRKLILNKLIELFLKSKYDFTEKI